MIETTPKFQTKTGYCYLRDSRLVLTRGGERSTQVRCSPVISWLAVSFQFIMGALLLLEAYVVMQDEFRPLVIALALLSAWLLYGSLTVILGRYSTVTVISKDSIQSVKFCRGVRGFTRSRFVVTFRNPRGKIHRRLIMLPGSMNGGNQVTDNEALGVMDQYVKTVS